jgi:hypothetical protein
MEKPDEDKDVNELLETYDQFDDNLKSLMIVKVDSKTSNNERRHTQTKKQVEEE